MTATSGFCTQYCAWHTYYVASGIPIKFAFVGNGARCPNSCAPFTPAPNGNQGADGMASTLVCNPTSWNPSPCPNSCAPFTPAPNGNQGSDGMASMLVPNPTC